jgi:hypothetical protein
MLDSMHAKQLICLPGLCLILWTVIYLPENDTLKPDPAVKDSFEKITYRADGDYLSPIHYCETNKDRILKNVPPGLFYQILATNYSYAGAYAESMRSWDLQADTNKALLSDSSRKLLCHYTFESARSVLLKKAVAIRVLMFNEAHHSPMQRAFVASLLPALRKGGYNYLAVETLNDFDLKALNQRGFVYQQSGVYTVEPVFAELIRSALTLGFKLIAYDASGGGTTIADRKQREEDQALKLSRVFKIDSSAKMIVLAGYGHIYETSVTIPMMAQLFKEYTGINPLTVDQVEMAERSSVVFENSAYTYLIQKHRLSEPVIFHNKSKDLVLGRIPVDLQLVYPRSTYEKGRACWLQWGGNKFSYETSWLSDVLPGNDWIIIQAFRSDTYEQRLVAADQILVKNPKHEKNLPALLLAPGSYLLRVATLSNKELYLKKITVNGS